MTTTPQATPLDKFRASRDQLLNTFLGGLGDLETEVIHFEHARSRDLDAARRELAEARRDNERLQRELTDLVSAGQAQNEAHAASESADAADVATRERIADLEQQLAAATADAARVAELAAQLAAARKENARLTKQLALTEEARDKAAGELAGQLAAGESTGAETESLRTRLAETEAKLAEAERRVAELASRPQVTGISEEEVQARIDQVRSEAEGNAHNETLRVLHAIHADNPEMSLTEAMDLFTVAHGGAVPVTAVASVEQAVPLQAAAPVAAEQAAHPQAVAPVITLPDLDDDPFADDAAEAPAAFTPVVVPAPGTDPADGEAHAEAGDEDPIVDPHFFDIPPTPAQQAPVLGGPVDAPAPVPPVFTGPVDAPAAAAPAPVKAFPVPAIQSVDLDFDLFAEPETEKKVA